jgi:hypothetical protein
VSGDAVSHCKRPAQLSPISCLRTVLLDMQCDAIAQLCEFRHWTLVDMADE